jgi:hypothetical protein
MMEWQDISTAPKDGSIVLLFRPTAPDWGRVTPGKWEIQEYHKKPQPFWEIWFKIGGTFESRAWPPTHWTPLPAPPTPTAQEGGEG